MTVNMPSGYLKLYDVSEDSFSESYKIYFNSLSFSEKANTSQKPPLNKDISEVQKITFENAKISLKGVIINDAVKLDDNEDIVYETLSFSKLKEFYKKTNPDSNGDYLVLVVDYGTDSPEFLQDFDGETNGIRVTITNYDMSLMMNRSNGKYAFEGTISFIESK